jgi:hypothetical protein
MSIPIKATLAITLVWPAAVVAGLEPISDRQLSGITGQAFVSVDRQYHPDPENNTAYTRVNLGMDIEVQTNIDVLELGRYDRVGEKAGSSGLPIENFALGHINNQAYYSGKNSSVPLQRFVLVSAMPWGCFQGRSEI